MTIFEKPLLEVKNVSLNTKLSEETPAYSAKLFVDGHPFAEISNHGHGGCDDIRPIFNKHNKFTDWKSFHAELALLNERIAATFPPYEFEGGDPLTADLECECHGQVWRWADANVLGRKLARKTYFSMDGKIYSWNAKYDPDTAARLRRKFPKAIHINALPSRLAMLDHIEAIQGPEE